MCLILVAIVSCKPVSTKRRQVLTQEHLFDPHLAQEKLDGPAWPALAQEGALHQKLGFQPPVLVAIPPETLHALDGQDSYLHHQADCCRAARP